MASGKLLALGVCALALISPTLTQGNCDFSDLFTPETLETLIETSLTMGDNPVTPSVTVQRNHTLCLSVGSSIGKVSSVSLLIDYTCTVGSGTCPRSSSPTEQFDFGCNKNGHWSTDQFFNFGASRKTNPSANFESLLRTDCAVCFRRHPDPMALYVPFDPITHCVSKSTMHGFNCKIYSRVGLAVIQLCRVSFACTDCSSECISAAGQGPVMCYARLSCCNVYVNGLCRPSCPSSFHVTNSERECGELYIIFIYHGCNEPLVSGVYSERNEFLVC